MIDISVTFAILLGRPWFHPLGGVLSTLHQKIKFPNKDKVVTISTETDAAITALRLAPKEIPISPIFKICIIYESWINEKVVLNMMRNMKFFPGMGLGKNQQGLPGFMDPKTPRLKHGIGYGEEDGSDTELDIWDQLDKEEKIEAKKGTLEATFAREGTTYPYKGIP